MIGLGCLSSLIQISMSVRAIHLKLHFPLANMNLMLFSLLSTSSETAFILTVILSIKGTIMEQRWVGRNANLIYFFDYFK